MAELADLIRALTERREVRWIALAYVVAALGTSVFLFVYGAVQQERLADDFAASTIASHAARLAELETLVGQLRAAEEQRNTAREVESAADSDPPTSEARDLAQRLADVEGASDAMAADLQKLRALLNPTAPAEVLAVLRVGDKFELLRSELDALKAETGWVRDAAVTGMERRLESVQDEVERVSGKLWSVWFMALPAILVFLAQLGLPLVASWREAKGAS